MTKPQHICGRDGCGERAKWQAVLVLRGSPIRGETTIRCCDVHRSDAADFVLNDENRDRLVATLVLEGYADRFIADGMLRHNAFIEFDPFAS